MIEKQVRFTYEPGEPGEGYVALASHDREVKQQVRIEDEAVEGLEHFKGELIIDLNEDGKIIGIEILGDVLPDELK